jgi:hypothetical protein
VTSGILSSLNSILESRDVTLDIKTIAVRIINNLAIVGKFRRKNESFGKNSSQKIT